MYYPKECKVAQTDPLKPPAAKGVSLTVILNRVCQLFSELKRHPAAFIFEEPMDPVDAVSEEVMKEFTTLSLLQIQFKIGNKFETSD